MPCATVAWFKHLCRALGADPGVAFTAHIGIFAPEALRGPFNHPARAAAGLKPEWYSVGPEHRMGHAFDSGGDRLSSDDEGVGGVARDQVVAGAGREGHGVAEGAGGPGEAAEEHAHVRVDVGAAVDVDAARESSAALVERLKQMLALEGLTELPPSDGDIDAE